MDGAPKGTLLAVIALALGCALSPEQCEDNYETCDIACADEKDVAACLRMCDEEFGACLEAGEKEDERVQATFEVLGEIFDGDDDEC
ncbi:MAG: hypothetical protein AAF721_13410 [Myxococcota bacterium]